MLKEINNLGLFFEDCYREVSVREYAREIKISPPTASKLLKGFVKEGLLNKREERGFLLFRVNRESVFLRDLSRIYWRKKLDELIEFLDNETHFSGIVLFGSLSKLEATKDSDIDIMIFSDEKQLNLENFEKKLKRKIQCFFNESINNVPKNLKMNVLMGYLMEGMIV